MRVLRRSQWGASTRLPRRGYRIGPLRRTEVFIHHTVTVDNDATPNEWETVNEVRERMQRLQRTRPDLGLDVPYNFVAFCMRDGELLICEGRGVNRTGAHTKNHNRSALGIAIQGDFENGPAPRHLDGQLEAMALWLRQLRNSQGLINLGQSRPDRAQVWGHRDAQGARTVCPGQILYNRLGQIRFIDEEDDIAMDKPTWKFVQRALQKLDPPLYAGKRIDGLPGRNTSIAVRAFERRIGLESRGVIGALNDPRATIWPASRELLFTLAERNLRKNLQR